MTQIKIIVAGNNYLLGKGLECLIDECKDFRFLANALSEKELISAPIAKADVLVIDLSTITFKQELIQEVKALNPSIQILAFNSYQPKGFVTKVLEQGVTSYLMMNCDKEEITQAIYKTAKSERFLCGWVVEVILGGSKKSSEYSPNCPLYSYCGGVSISERELEVIKCIAEGYSNQQIADKLFLSVHTVTTHRKNIMNKLGINNTAGIVMYAVREQLISAN
jgi:DNA-binding NarL/FixJ family response regulator